MTWGLASLLSGKTSFLGSSHKYIDQFSTKLLVLGP